MHHLKEEFFISIPNYFLFKLCVLPDCVLRLELYTSTLNLISMSETYYIQLFHELIFI